jgi:hypothetical protein
MDGTEIKFDAPSVLRKWPSLKNERISNSWGARPYFVSEGTLDECIQQFMSKPASQHHLYEIPHRSSATVSERRPMRRTHS